MATWLRGQSGNLITGHGTFVQTEKGIRIKLSSGAEFPFTVTTGQDDVEVAAPGVVVSATEAEQSELLSLNFLVSIDVILRFPADEGVTENTGLIEAFRHAATQLSSVLYRDDLEARLSESEEGFTALHRPEPWRERSEPAVDGGPPRVRGYRWSTRLHVALADIQEPAP